MLRRALLFGALAVATGCSPLPIVDRSSFTDKAGNEPHFGERSEAPLGGLMYSQFSYLLRSGARITEANRQPFGLGGLFISRGEVVFPSSLGGASVYCSDKRVYSDPIAGFLSKACFSDRDGDRRFDTVQVAPESTWIQRPLSPTLPYATMDVPVAERGAFKFELAYDGYSGQSLHLSYREFRGKSLERPVYTQQAKYDVARFPADIVFRSVKLQILDADNMRIVYRVLSGF
ncbi:MAG: hypothetical protein U1E83_00625 [Methylotetracoccus sp.]